MTPPSHGPEAIARIAIDAALAAAGWIVQDRSEINLSAARGVAVREFKLKHGHGFADYLLFLDGKAVGVLEAKPPGHTLIGVEPQSTKYVTGLPDGLNPPITPLPFIYLGTGAVTKFVNLLDPEPRSRFVFHVHRPETLAEWLAAPTLDAWVKDNGAYTAADETRPATLRARLRAMPELVPTGLYPNQVQAIVNLEQSLRKDKPRALLQMATGSGKTLTSVAEIYRLIKFGGARRVLFLVDRSNLGEQAEKEFQNYETPDDHRKFTALYNVQRLTSNTIDAASRVVITTIQRLYPMLKGEASYDEPEDDGQLDPNDALGKEPIPVEFNLTIARVLRRHLRRRVPPEHLFAVAPGARVLRRIPDRPHGHARQAHLRVLPPEPRHGVRPRPGCRRWRQRRLRDLQDPHQDHRGRRHDRH